MTEHQPELARLTEPELDVLREAHWPVELEGDDNPFRRQSRFESAVEDIIAARLAPVRAVLDGRLSNHHDACDSWRRGFKCDCWRADLRSALGIETEEEADRARHRA